MQAYRETPAFIPLLTSIGGLLLAVDPENGALVWSNRFERTIGRLVVAGNVVFVATRSSLGEESFVFMLDLATGAQRGVLDTGFNVEAALVRNDRVYFTGRDGCLVLTAVGIVLWRIVSQVTKKDAWNGDARDVVCLDATGRERWRMPQPSFGQASFVALGDLVAHADFEG